MQAASRVQHGAKQQNLLCEGRLPAGIEPKRGLFVDLFLKGSSSAAAACFVMKLSPQKSLAWPDETFTVFLSIINTRHAAELPAQPAGCIDAPNVLQLHSDPSVHVNTCLHSSFSTCIRVPPNFQYVKDNMPA